MAEIQEQILDHLKRLILEAGLIYGTATWDDPPQRLAVYDHRSFHFAYLHIESGAIVLHFPMMVSGNFSRHELCDPGAIERAVEELRMKGHR